MQSVRNVLTQYLRRASPETSHVDRLGYLNRNTSNTMAVNCFPSGRSLEISLKFNELLLRRL